MDAVSVKQCLRCGLTGEMHRSRRRADRIDRLIRETEKFIRQQ